MNINSFLSRTQFTTKIITAFVVFGLLAVFAAVLAVGDASSNPVSVLFSQASAADSTINIRAVGKRGGKRMELHIGGTFAQDWDVSDSYDTYTYTGSLAPEDTIEVHKPWSSGAIIVDYISVDGVKRYGDSQDTTNTGAWTSSDGCTTNSEETITCPGYIDFGEFNDSTANNDYTWTSQGEAVNIDVLTNDGNPSNSTDLTVEGITDEPENGTAVIESDDTITYTPDDGFSGHGSFSYQMSNPDGETDTADVNVRAYCPFTESGSGSQSFDQVVVINEDSGSGVRSDNGNAEAKTRIRSLDLDSGTYRIGMFGYDDARGSNHSRSDQDQDGEQFFLRFSENADGSGSAVETPSTEDLDDEPQFDTTTEIATTTFSQSISGVQARNSVYFDKISGDEEDVNSLGVGCIGISQAEPTVNLSASPSSIDYVSSTTLNWTYENVSSGTTTSDTGNSQWANTDVFPDDQSCPQDGSCSGSNSTEITNLTQDTTFNITLDGAYGNTASDSVFVDVADKPVQLSVDLNAVQLGDDAQLTWDNTNMNDCAASSNPTNSQWASTTDPDPSGGTTTVTDLATSTGFTLTCTENDTTISDSVNVEVVGFDTALSADNIWGVPFANSVTTQSRIVFDATDSFSSDIELSASAISSPSYSVDLQFLDADGNMLSDNPVINQDTYNDDIWLQAQVGSGVEPGRQQVKITADAVDGTSSTSHIIDMFIRGINEF